MSIDGVYAPNLCIHNIIYITVSVLLPVPTDSPTIVTTVATDTDDSGRFCTSGALSYTMTFNSTSFTLYFEMSLYSLIPRLIPSKSF